MKIRIFSIIIMILIACAGLATGQQDISSPNLVKNGNFDMGLSDKGIPLYWGEEPYNESLVPGEKGGNCLMIKNTQAKESLGAQSFPLDGRKVKWVSVSCQVKGVNIVPGKIAWQRANLQPLFFDAKDQQVGGWPELGPWAGTFDWMSIRRNFAVPLNARKMKIVLGLYGCPGEIYFDDIRVSEYTGRQDAYDFVSNGDFEIWENWAYGGTEGGGAIFPGFHDNAMLKIHNPVPTWSFATQSIPLDGKTIKEIKVEAWLKIENVVPGPKPWQKARINIEFKDRQGKRIGGWPIVHEADGSFDWKKVSSSFPVPEETRRVDLFVGLMECSGTLFADDVRMEAALRSGGRATKQGTISTNTADFYAFTQKADPFNKNALDLSALLDKPAGKHGFMKVKGDHFYFEDGTRARFWGTNIYGTDLLVDKKTAEKMAQRLAKYGCNLVRVHHLDAFWADPNIFDKKYNDTQHLNKDSLDKLDYLIGQLKKNGIYVFMDLLVDREFKAGDNVSDYQRVERGAKICGFFDPRIISLQKKYAEELLLHKNPYTNLRYVDDPAVVSVKLINEAMLYYISTQTGLSPAYKSQLDDLWNNWLNKKYKNREGLKQSWTDRYGRCDLEETESPSFGNVRRGETLLKFQRSGYEKLEPLRNRDTMEFYYSLQTSYFKEMEKFLQGIGVKVPISGSNHWVNISADVKSNSELDYIDRHRYFDHPQFGYGTQIVFENQSMLLYPEEALPNNFAFYKVAGKPFVISEWNTCFPNEFRAEGPIIMASYALLQDWDGVLEFSFNKAGWYAPIRDNFDISSWPNYLGQWQLAALMFHRKDLSVAANIVEEALKNQDIFGPIIEDEPVLNEPLLPLISRTQRKFVSDSFSGALPNLEGLVSQFIDRQNKILTSDTGQISWDWGKGIFSVHSQKTQAAIGFIGKRAVGLPNLEVDAENSFACVTLSSLTNAPISNSKHLLLSASGRIENTAQKYNYSKTQLTEIGREPLLVEGISARIKIKCAGSRPKVFSLDENGDRKFTLETFYDGANLTFTIDKRYQAQMYEVVIE